MEDEIDINFEFKIQEKLKVYFEKHNHLTSSDELGRLLEEIGMSLWNTDEIKNMVWTSLLEYQKNGTIDYEGTKKAFHELLNEEGQNEENNRMTTFVKENDESNKKTQQQYETPENLNQFSCFKLYQLRKVFELLNLSNRQTIKIGSIKDLINNTELIKLSEAEIINSVLAFSSQKSSELNMALSSETSLIINKAGYQHTVEAIEDKLLKEYKNRNDDDDYSFHEDKEPNELIEQLDNTQTQAIDYISVLNDIKIALTNMNVDIVCTYEKMVQNNDYSLKPSADALQNSFESKLRDFEIFLKGLMQFTKGNTNKIESLKGGVNQLYKEIQVGNEQYKDLFEKYSSNQALDLQEEITEAFEENMILKEEREDLKKKFEKLQRELGNRDLEITKMQYDHSYQLNEFKEEITNLKKEKEELSVKFENTFQDVLEKINEETKTMENNGTINSNDTNNQQMDINTLKNVLGQMSFSPEEKEVAMEIKKQLTKGNQEELIRNVIKTEINNKRLNEQQKILNEQMGSIEKERKNAEKESATRNNEITILKSKVQLLENKVHDLNLEIQAKNPPMSYCLGRMSRISVAQEPLTSTSKKGAGNVIFGTKKTAQFDVFGSQTKQPSIFAHSASNTNANRNIFQGTSANTNQNIEFKGAVTSKKKEPTSVNVLQTTNTAEFQGKTSAKPTELFQSSSNNVEVQGKTAVKPAEILQSNSNNVEYQKKTQEKNKQQIVYQSSSTNVEVQGKQIETKPIVYQSTSTNAEFQGNNKQKQIETKPIVYQSTSSNVEFQGIKQEKNEEVNPIVYLSSSTNVEVQGIKQKETETIVYQSTSTNIGFEGNIKEEKKDPIILQTCANNVEYQENTALKKEPNMYQSTSSIEYNLSSEVKKEPEKMEYQIEQSNDTLLSKQEEKTDIDEQYDNEDNKEMNENDNDDNNIPDDDNEHNIENENITIDGYLPGIDEEANEDDKENERKESINNNDEIQPNVDGTMLETTTNQLDQLSEIKIMNPGELMQLHKTNMRLVKSQANFDSNFSSTLISDNLITQKNIFQNKYLDLGSEDEMNTINEKGDSPKISVNKINERQSANLKERESKMIINDNTNGNLEECMINTEVGKKPRKRVVKRTFSEIYEIPKTQRIVETMKESKRISLETDEKKTKKYNDSNDQDIESLKIDKEDIVQSEINKIKINPKGESKSSIKAIPPLKINEIGSNQKKTKGMHRTINSDRIVVNSKALIDQIPEEEEEYKDNLKIKSKPTTGKKKQNSSYYQSTSYKFNSPVPVNADNNKKLLEHIMDLNENGSLKSIYKNDYLSLHAIESIQEKLKENKEDYKTCEIFSDFVFLFDEINKKTRKIILVTDKSIYFFNLWTLTSDCEFSYSKLESIYVSSTNPNMINFHFTSRNNDLLIETFKKTELLLFIKENYNKGDKALHFKFEKNMSLLLKGKFCSMQDSHKHFKNMPYFEFGRKVGYLFKYKGGFITKKYQEQLVVLTDVGLIYFEDITKPPRRLIPIIGSDVETLKNPFQLRPYVFKITLKPSNEVHIFSAHTEEELHDWTNGFDKLKKHYDKRMKKLDTIEKEIERFTVHNQEQNIEEGDIIDDNENDYSD